MTPQELASCQSALEAFLESSQGNLTPSTSSRVVKAREKLKKLTTIQFSDLSTDVYDEMNRRETNRLDPDNIDAIKFLPSQSNYHPKRNQARQKLAALPPSRFKDLVNDVLHEIKNRTELENSKTINEPIPKKNNNNLTIDVEKSKNYNSSNDFSNLKTPIKTPITPSQREIKPTTLVPSKSELTWSSDEEDEDIPQQPQQQHQNEHYNVDSDVNKLDIKLMPRSVDDNEDSDHDAIYRSPSKRYTIATNEVLNEHAPPNVEFPVDNDDDINKDDRFISDDIQIKRLDPINELNSKVDELEQDNAYLKSLSERMDLENKEFKEQVNDLSRRNDELEEKIEFLNTQCLDYDNLKEELKETKEAFSSQTEELNALKEITNDEQEKKLSSENSREIDTLKTYLDKVLEENEELKSKVIQLQENPIEKVPADFVNELETLKQRYQKLTEEYEELDKSHDLIINDHTELNSKYKSLLDNHDELNKNYNLLNEKSRNTLKQFEVVNRKEQNTPLSSINVTNGLVATTAGMADVAGSLIGSGIGAMITDSNRLRSKEGNTEVNERAMPIINSKDSSKDSSLESMVLEWQNKFESLRSNQIKTRIGTIASLPNINEKKLFSSTGLISIDKVSNVYSSLETVLVYLDSVNTESDDYSLVNPNEVNPIILFERVSSFVSHANALSKEIDLQPNNKLYLRVEESKRVLKNSIANVLSTTRHFAIYLHLIPKLLMNAALNDVYFAICSLISLVKIYSENSTSIEVNKPLKDNGKITSTPIAFKTVSNEHQNDEDGNVTNDDLDTSPLVKQSKLLTTESQSVRPLRITQRLASNSTNSLDMSSNDSSNNVSKPANMHPSRHGSPMILNSSILPVIVASTDDLHDSQNNDSKLTTFGTRKSLSGYDKISNGVSLGSSNAEEQQLPNNSNKKSSGLNLASNLSDSSTFMIQNEANNVSKASLSSPIRSDNMINKIKKFDSSIEDVPMNATTSSHRSSPNNSVSSSSEVEISKTLDKFDAKSNNADSSLIESGVANKSANSTKSEITVNKVKAESFSNAEKDNNNSITNGAGGLMGAIVAPKILKIASNQKERKNLEELEKLEKLEKSEESQRTDEDEKEAVKENGQKAVNVRDAQESEVNVLGKKEGEKVINTEMQPPVAKVDIEIPGNGKFQAKAKNLDYETPTSDSFPAVENNHVEVETPVNYSVVEAETPGAKDTMPTSIDKVDLNKYSKINEEDVNPFISKTVEKTRNGLFAKDEESESEFESATKSATESGNEFGVNHQSYPFVRKEASTKKSDIDDKHTQKLALNLKSNAQEKNADHGEDNEDTDKDDDEEDKEDYDKEDDFNNYRSNSKPASPSESYIEQSLPSAGSALDIDEKLIRRVSRRGSKNSYKSMQGLAGAPVPSLIHDDHNRKRNEEYQEEEVEEGWKYNEEDDEYSDEEGEEEFNIDKFNTLNPDNTLRELLLYLEHQTVEVIKAIQQTLQSIRDPKATKGLLRIGAEEINLVVKQMAEGTSTLMNQSRYVESMGHAKYVVGVLEDCVLRMESLYGSDLSKDEEFAGKSFKQRSAGIAFDVARTTKELVKTVEEASLRDEIAVLDSRLRN